MDLLKALQSQAEQVEVVDLVHEATIVEFSANRFKSSKVEEMGGTAVRAVKDGRLGFAASSDKDALDKLAVNVLELAAYGDKVPIQFPSKGEGVEVRTYDPKIAELPVSRMVEIGEEIVEHILEIDPETKVKITVRRGVQQFAIHNHTGYMASYTRSPLSIEVIIRRVEGDDVLILYDMSGVTVWQKDYMAFVRGLGERLRLARNLTTIEAGRMPVVLSPSGAIALVLPVMQGVNGKNVFKGVSPMAGKLGERLFHKGISFSDDATIDGGFRSAPFDEEGVPHRRSTLVEKGELKGFVYDLLTAAQSGVESTGNGARDLFNPPQPAPTHIVLEPGETDVVDMLCEVDHGLLVEDVLGLGQGNILSGAFSNPLSLAFKIEKGEIVGRVKDVSIAGNVYEVLKDVGAVSRESRWVYNRARLPYLLIPNMKVVARQR